MMYGSGKKLTFRDFVQGTWGSFSTPAGRVDYIMTKARLGEDSDDPERLLTKSLAPVREVMDAGDLDFNQLLQRDLDDHRVAVSLIPYLLRPQATGPAFFPPIVAVLLPFRNKLPAHFPPMEASTTVDADDARWLQEQAGTCFQVQRLLGESDRLHPANVGKLWWNKTESQLVVLDGQHRAMALLSVERTMTNSWQDSGGARFRSFYESQVQQALREYDHTEIDLGKVEVPVTVCWFPDQTGPDAKPHEAARKLFVDVNKEARPPSESRIILLSDAEMSNVLTRRMLNELRRDDNNSFLPLYAVEYDNPEVNSSRSARWSVLTNIHLLKLAVDRCIFGPPKYLKDVTLKFVGRPSTTEQDAFMREQLDLTSLFPDQFDDGGFRYQRDKIGNTEFPIGKMETIGNQFAETWGRAILTVLSRTQPYSAHAKALSKLKDDWHVDDTGLSLAHDALFNGVGVFWTLRDSYEHYLDRKSLNANTTKSDVIKAWEALRNREDSFETYRAAEFLDSSNLNALRNSKAAYAVFNTHACQLGLVMTLGSLWQLRKEQSKGAALEDLHAFAEALVAGWNSYFSMEPGKAKDRRLAFAKTGITNPLNQIANMDTPQSVYFRYFWMQVLATPPAWEQVSPWFEESIGFDRMLSAARDLYLKLCADQQLKALKISKPGTPEATLQVEAKKAASLSMKRALRDWFYLSEDAFASWVSSLAKPPTGADVTEDSSTDTDADTDESEDGTADESPAISLEDLLGN